MPVCVWWCGRVLIQRVGHLGRFYLFGVDDTDLDPEGGEGEEDEGFGGPEDIGGHFCCSTCD